MPNTIKSKSHESDSDSNSLADCEDVLVALRRVIRATDLHSKQLSKHTGLTTPQLLIMRTIQAVGEVSIGSVAERVSLSQATVTTILDRLEQRGLVYRVRSATDKRKVHAHLTEEGLALIDRAPALLQERFIQRFQSLEDWERKMMVSSLQRIAGMMGDGHADSSPMLAIGALDSELAPAAEDQLPAG